MNNQTMAEKLKSFYFEWANANDFLAVERMAEDHKISVDDAELFIELGRLYHEGSKQGHKIRKIIYPTKGGQNE